ncbi:glycosyltransferase family 4 protein [Herbihabitans rhizosphaerae]|uniref:glycosyltransferase family 4 protein n=1 Tax=Herbihabitans rhizosphaerae TaxID=1872711 RepID=UPI00102CC3B8|nr:glycosyltransferase family 1 protein [Herbihabitans rhizosphaerae]
MPELVVLTEQLLAPVPGGTGRYTAELARALAATTPNGWSVTGVTAAHRDLSAARLAGVRGPRPLPLPRRALTLAWERGVPLWPGGRHSGDSVHAPTPLAPAAPKKGRRLVVTVHDTVPFTHPETLTPRGVAWHRAMITRATRTASAVVVPTDAVAEELRRYAPGPAPVHTVPHGVSAVFTETVAPQRFPAGYILAVGTIEPRKGLDVLIDALAHPAAPDLPLVIVGQPGWGAVDLAARAAERGLAEGRVRLVGRLDDADLAAMMAGATVLAAPSHAEGFGLPVLEAMAAGVPVVHTDVPALVEVSAGAAVVVPIGDAGALAEALAEVAGDSSRAAAMVERGRARAAELTWERAAEAVWRLHTEV